MNTMEEPKTEQKFETKLYPMMIEEQKFKLLDRMRSKDESRYALQMFHQVNGCILTSDGKRAIKISNAPALPDGCYELISSKKNKTFVEFILRSMDIQSPAFSQVWFKTPKKITALVISKGSFLSSTIIDIFQLTKRCINSEFIEDLIVTKYEEKWGLFVESGEEENNEKPIMLRSGADNEIEVLILPYKYEPAKLEA